MICYFYDKFVWVLFICVIFVLSIEIMMEVIGLNYWDYVREECVFFGSFG